MHRIVVLMALLLVVLWTSPAFSGTSYMCPWCVNATKDSLGWNWEEATNQACTKTCKQKCVFGVDNSSVVFAPADCDDDAADLCMCTGPNG